MILSRTVYKNNKEIRIEDLSNGSHILVLVKCDYCDNTREIPYKKYTKSIENNGKYSCSYKCRSLKTKEINLDRFGVNCNLHSEDGKSKVKKTMIDKYGVDNFSKSDNYKEKTYKSNIEKYGTKHFFQSEYFKNSSNKTLYNKYGIDSYSKTNEFKEKYKNTCLNKYGETNTFKVEIFKEQIKNTNIEKYGVDYYTKTDEFKEKVRNTNIEKYGVDYYIKTDEFKEISKITCLNKYGNEYYFQSNSFKIKSEDTLLNKYGVNNYLKSFEFRTKTLIGTDVNYIKYIGDSISLFNCDKGHTFEIKTDNYFYRIKNNIPLCTICNPIGDSKSIKEKELLYFIQNNYDGEIISGYRDGLEIDIYLPELKLGFEFNGLYWHSEKFKDKRYHLYKTNHFKERNIRIIHIWEDDWTLRRRIIESQISNILNLNTTKIFARKCIVKEITDSKLTRKFLDNNHIQGHVNSSIKLGLYYQDELVSIITFDSFEGRKKMGEGGYNLNRFCNKLNTNVVGGASKLLTYFIKNYNPTRIVSYADKDWSIGQLYYTLGFNNISESKPDYKYIINNIRVHKSRYKKSKLNTSLTESQEMIKRDILKVYDCGKIKFELN